MTGRWRHWLGSLTGAAVMAMLVGRFGADVVLDGFRRLRTLAGWGAAGLLALLALLVVGGLAVSRSRHGRLSRAVRATGADLHAALLTRRALPRVVAASVVVVAGHAAVVGAAARATGVGLSMSALAPLALLGQIVRQRRSARQPEPVDADA